MKTITLLLGAGALAALSAGTAAAGPCTAEIDNVTKLLASKDAGAGPTAGGASATTGQHPPSATMGAADILRRPDLGRIEKGAAADLLVIDALKPHLQPINDPVRSIVWYATPADIDTVLIDGRAVIRGGKVADIDEAAIIAEGAAATRRVWVESRMRGSFGSTGSISESWSAPSRRPRCHRTRRRRHCPKARRLLCCHS